VDRTTRKVIENQTRIERLTKFIDSLMNQENVITRLQSDLKVPRQKIHDSDHNHEIEIENVDADCRKKDQYLTN
jgi:hypothetical protein